MLPFPAIAEHHNAWTPQLTSLDILLMKTRKTKAENSLRIIAGQWRSRKVVFPDVEGLRPTADRIRETLFNWLQEHVARADCLDLFAGSGACGIEALSRGARHVTFIERSPVAAQAIRHSLATLQATDFEVFCEDSLAWLASPRSKAAEAYDLVFLDPPFASDLLVRSAIALEASGLLRDRALVYLESATELAVPSLPATWHLLKSKRAGNVHFYLMQRRTDPRELP